MSFHCCCCTNKLVPFRGQHWAPLPPPAALVCLIGLSACLSVSVCLSAQKMRATRHLGLRLRDQLLAFASVCALKLERGQLSPLGHTFENLASLSLSGKVSLDGQLLRELTTGLAAGAVAAAAGGSSGGSDAAGSSGGSGRGLQSLCLDVHFVGVGAEDVSAALQLLPGLKVGGAGGMEGD